MGGWGSGRQGGRPTADASRKIDLAWMLRTGRAREGAIVSGTLSWTCRGQPSGSISYKAIMDKPGNARLELSFTRGEGADREDVKQTVQLCFTSPHYGGKRWWMLCPFKGVRAGKLYLPPCGDRFASRQAWRLGYHIQRVARRDVASERLFRLQGKLKCELGVGNFPGRPKGMWRRTYERHMKLFWKLDGAAHADMELMMERLR